MEPSRVGPYLIDRKIGAGGMGTVYLAHHAETGQQAAVKVLPSSLAQEEGLISRFQREVDALTKLSNPHVVECFDSGIDDDNTYYYAMEYVDGETVADLLRREKRLGWETVIELSVQICTALKAAHDAGIIHRDLKPSNLLITRDNQIKLADFGIAQVFAGRKLTMTGGVVGTAEYMSPEQAQGQRATRKSDLYSLGAVMYAMLTGRPPFTGKTAVEVLQKHRFNQFDAPRLIRPEIPVWLDDVVCQLMEKDPDKRFPDAYVLSLRLKEIPKKVALANLQETRTADPAAYRNDATTLAVSSQAAGEQQAGPGGGTLMRDLLRAEIERQQQPSPVGRVLDSTWFLLAVLVLLVAGGFYWMQSRELSPEEKFAAGRKLMQQPEGEAWITARDLYFAPLVKADPEEWKPQVAPYLDQIERYALKRRLDPGKLVRNRPPPKNEAERFLRLAAHYREIGEVAHARRILLALVDVLSGQPEYRTHFDQAQALLAEIDNARQPADGSRALLKAALERADRLAAEGRVEAARAIYDGVMELYGSDATAGDAVRAAREKRDNLPHPAPPQDEP